MFVRAIIASLVAKFIRDKRINFSCRGSYEMRCAAAISFNSKRRSHDNFHKSVTTKSPGCYTKKKIKAVLSQRSRQINLLKTRRRL